MSRKLAASITGILVTLAVTLGGCGPKVTFPDPGLAKAVAQQLGGKANSFGDGAVAKITELDASNRQVASLEGIAALDSLEVLNLDGNQLVDLEPLVDADLPNLKRVSIAGNPLPVGLDSAVYSEVKTLRRKGVSVNWLPSFVAPMGHYSYITDMVQAPDGSLVAINEGRLFHVDLFGKDAWSDGSPGPAYSLLANIVQADRLVLVNSRATDEYGPWEYYYQRWGELDTSNQLRYPNGVYRMTLTPDGGYLLVGLPFGDEDSALVARLDKDNNEIWSGSYRGQGGGISGIAIPNGYLILCRDGLIQLDSQSKKVKTLDFASHTVGQARSPKIVQTQNGYAVMAFPVGHQESTALVTFTADLAVNKVVQTPVPNGPDDHSMVFDFDATDDGGFVLAVHNWAFPETSADGLLVKIDGDGRTLWSRSYKDYALGFVLQTADGGFAVGAHAVDWMTYIIKTDINGLVGGQ